MQLHRQQKNRAILTEQQAIEIFRLGSENSMTMMVSSATFVARRYGINERTVRDIWKQRTWSHATSSLAEGTGPMANKKMGRPIGSKDTSPRKQMLATGTSISSDAPSSPKPQFYASRLNFEPFAQPNVSEQVHQDSAPRQPISSVLPVLLKSSADAIALGDRTLIQDEREASIDDQLHCWARCGPRWIIDAALLLAEDNPWDHTPSVR